MTEKSKFAQKEEEILSFWEQNKIFEKTLTKKSPKGDYVFYDGPPFATGLPHYGHIVASLMKDAIPRFRTMQGYHVERRWGWDCHGLPIENIAEKELGIKRKKEIYEIGVDKFNEYCRSKVLEYVEEWKKVIRRLGRWADMENAYKTMDLSYMESVCWVFKELWQKGLIYEGYRSMHICPRCETTLSQQEVAEGYKDIKDISVTVKFELEDEPGTYVLAWTTTPWTLIGNVALAVGAELDYVKFSVKSHPQIADGVCITSKKDLEDYLVENQQEAKYTKILQYLKGKELIGKKYKPLFSYYINKGLNNEENGWKIYAASFVTTEEGTGIVHIAPAFGEDDLNLGNQYQLPFIQHIGYDGVIKKEALDFAGMNVKPAENHQKTDIEVVNYLKKKDLLFAKEEYVHSYPHCWRCETPLINYATSSWFVNVMKIKEKALALAKEINWSPAHIKEGRFGNWLAGARDWSISRQRFWASVIPIWKCQNNQQLTTNNSQLNCDNIKVIGSVKELEELSGQKITDLHKHLIDQITFPCEKCGGIMRRIPDVLDCWFESGSMPYAQIHYPFDPDSIASPSSANYGARNKEKRLTKLPKNFPATFIAEGVDQTRAWFYYLHIIATALMKSPAYKNVIVNGIVLAEDGQKMSKSKGNYPDPELIFNKYSVDALRYYLFSSPVMVAENLNFSEKGVDESLKKVVILLGNVLNFYLLYAPQEKAHTIKDKKSNNVLDRWILARLNQLISEETQALESYDLPRACRPLAEFIADLSTWYLRRSRARFKDETAKKQALNTLRYTLYILSKLLAPFLPFMAEEVYQTVTGYNFQTRSKSVHLADWPKMEKADQKIIAEMEPAKKIVEQALSARAKAGIKIRQPLNFYSTDLVKKLPKEIIEIIKEELNIKELRFGKEELDIKIDDKLKKEGLVRDLTRLINNLRKEAGLTINDKVTIYFESTDKSLKKIITGNKKQLIKNTLSQNFKEEKINKQSFCLLEAKINGQVIKLGIKR